MAKFFGPERGPRSGLRLIGPVSVAAVIGAGIWWVAGSDGPNDYNNKLVEATDKVAVGQPFPRSEFTMLPVGPASKEVARYAINNMLMGAGEPPVTGAKGEKKPDNRVLAAATCALLAANNQPMATADKKSWGAGQHAAQVPDAKPSDTANLFTDAGTGCLAALNARISDHAITTLVAPAPIAP